MELQVYSSSASYHRNGIGYVDGILSVVDLILNDLPIPAYPWISHAIFIFMHLQRCHRSDTHALCIYNLTVSTHAMPDPVVFQTAMAAPASSCFPDKIFYLRSNLVSGPRGVLDAHRFRNTKTHIRCGVKRDGGDCSQSGR